MLADQTNEAVDLNYIVRLLHDLKTEQGNLTQKVAALEGKKPEVPETKTSTKVGDGNIEQKFDVDQDCLDILDSLYHEQE